jgi:hypothetical protein
MTFKNSARTVKKTPHFTVTKNWLTLFKEIIAVYSGNHIKTCKQDVELLNVAASGT